MGLFGLFAGLLTASKVHKKIHDDDSSLGEDMLDMGISVAAGSIVGDIVDDIFDDEDDVEVYDDDDDY